MTLTGQTCLLGYSLAAALNQPLGAVNTNTSGYYSGTAVPSERVAIRRAGVYAPLLQPELRTPTLKSFVLAFLHLRGQQPLW